MSDGQHLGPDSFDLGSTRAHLGLTQTQMAAAMGMPLRSYQDIEGGKNPVRPIHVRAAYYACLDTAVREQRFDLLTGDARALALSISDIAPK